MIFSVKVLTTMESNSVRYKSNAATIALLPMLMIFSLVLVVSRPAQAGDYECVVTYKGGDRENPKTETRQVAADSKDGAIKQIVGDGKGAIRNYVEKVACTPK
jgi:hypothetical protein